jgi:phage recombination protein Bet
MPAPRKDDLEEKLRRSVFEVQQRKAKRIQMTEAIVVHRDVSGPLEFSAEQTQMIRDSYANGATESEFKVLLEVAKLRRLNPLLRQVHFVSRWNKKLNRNVWTAQVSIDGLRAIAERTGKYDGQDEPEFELNAQGRIVSCKVKIYRKDWSRPAVGVAYWAEYVQKYNDEPTKFWADMPHVMIAKCAEAIAIRKAFPEDASDLYVDEEMQQADNSDNGTSGAFSPHLAPGEDPKALGDADTFRALCGRLATVESDLETCDSYDKVNAIRAILGTKAKQSDLTRTMQQKAEAGDVSPSQRQELGKSWQRCNRKCEKLEKELAPSVEDGFVDPDDGALDAFGPRAESPEA